MAMVDIASPLFIGTCSWADRSLVDSGLFYPPSARTSEGRLQFYAGEFPIVEVDTTYYGLPQERTAALWAERTPPGFRFHVKAFSLFTQHPTSPRFLPPDVREALPEPLRRKGNLYVRDLPAELVGELWKRFEQALQPLSGAGKLGLVLLQFPRWFFPSIESMDYILGCQERLPRVRLAVEFRSGTWLNQRNAQRVERFLRDNRLAFVCVDEPQGFASSVPPVTWATTEMAYVRFHGRNTETWESRGATAAERFDYYYSNRDLAEWMPRVRALLEESREVHLLFNTNKKDQGIVNARRLRALLEAG